MIKVFSILTLCIAITSTAAFADTNVKGYYRNDGTYVRPHVRSSPDAVKWNNYGPSKGVDMHNGRNRDNDNDGMPNYLDKDDNNNGISDDNDSDQY